MTTAWVVYNHGDLDEITTHLQALRDWLAADGR